MTNDVTIRTPTFEADDRIFEKPDTFIALAEKSFVSAAKAAVVQNDALGIPTHGSVEGAVVQKSLVGHL